MQPNDLSMPRADNRIKEKLNLHLKKRLQETSKNSAAEVLPSSSCSTAVAPLPGPSPGSKTKKQKTKHSPTSVTTSAISSNSSLNLSGGSFGSKPSASGEHLMLSPGALGGGNSNDTTNSSFNSVDLDPDNSNDGQDRTAEKSSPGGSSKVTPKADIFTLILNEKKNSLMRDPEVVKFLRDLIDARDKP